MKIKEIALLTLSLAATGLSAQTPVDTTLTLTNIEILGRQFTRLTGSQIRQLAVENNLSAQTNTTAEALRQLPSVITDIEGAVYFRGSDRTTLLLNGIPYGLLEENSGDVLIQLPALFFNQLSVATYPPINLVPEGDAGIINLSPARKNPLDSPLQLTLGAGYNERYNAGAMLNLTPGKFNITSKYDYRREYRKRSFEKTTTDNTGRAEMRNNASARPDIHTADLNVDYLLSDNDILSVYGLYHLTNYSRYGGINNKKVNPNEEVMNHVIRHRYNDQRQQAYAAEARWLHRFNNPDDLLNIVFNYNNFTYDEGNHYKNQKPETETILAEDSMYVTQEKKNFYLSADYRKVFTNGWLLRAGYTGRIKKENYTTESKNKSEELWITNTGNYDNFLFSRYTNQVYAGIGKELNAFNFEAGVQLEHTIQEIKTDYSYLQNPEKEEFDINNNYFHLFPRFRVSYQAGTASEWVFSYVQRANRPYGAALNPYINTSDATYILKGNPDLKDEFIHSFELGYVWKNQVATITPALYLRHKTNRMMDIYLPEEIWQKQNVGNSTSYGLEIAASWRPVRNLLLNLSGDVYRDQIDGQQIGYDEKKSLVCGNIKGSINLYITPATEIQLDGFYLSDQLTPQGKIKHRSSVNAGVSHYFMQRKLRANLSINNIFNELEETTVIHTPAREILQVRNRDSRVTWLTLTYLL